MSHNSILLLVSELIKNGCDLVTPISIFIVSFPEHSTIELRDLLSLLSSDEAQRARRYYRVADQRQFALSRAALRLLLSPILKLAPKEIIFDENAWGKPCIRSVGNVAIEFNLTHSGDFCLIALSPNSVGIDIENLEREIDMLGVAGRFFSAKECELLKNVSDLNSRKNIFFRIWTYKEALLKAIGMGFSYPLEDLDLSQIINIKKDECKFHFSKKIDEIFFLNSFMINKKYIAALATKELVAVDQVYKLHLQNSNQGLDLFFSYFENLKTL